MGYAYEKIDSSLFSEEYIRKSEQIEDLRDKLKIQQSRLSELMNSDIYNSTKIEGNSLTKREVTYYLTNHVTVRGKPLKDYKQIENYQRAVRAIASMVKDKTFVLSKDTICQIHFMLTENELGENESGHYRNDSVHIRGTSHIPPDAEEIPKHIDELLNHYYDNSDTLMTDFERICEFKRNFERIHPFFDGNGRTGRILSNILFLQSGYGYVTISPEYRVEYFDSIENNTLHEFFADRMIQSMEYIDEMHTDR